MSAPLPVRWIVVGLLVGIVPVTFVEALGMSILPYSGAKLEQFFRVWLWFLTCAAPIALLIGLPVALLWLRARGWIAWGFAGIAAGAIGGLAVMLVLALTTQLLTLMGHFLVATVVVVVLASGGGMLVALIARGIALFLTRRFG